MNIQPNLVIVGCGDIGSRVAEQLLPQHWTIYGLRQKIDALPAGVQPIAADLSQSQPPKDWPTGPIDYLLYSVAAHNHSEAGYLTAYVQGLQHVFNWLQANQQRPKRIFFTSSTGVYAQAEHQVVDEQSATEPTRWSGKIMLQAEQLLHASPYPTTAVRLAGIYGPGRNRLIQQVQQGATADPQLCLTNRIHADDAAGLICYLINADRAGHTLDSCYLGVDNQPVALSTVIDWLRETLHVTHSDPELQLQRSSSKHCSNQRARLLGWEPQYPSFREGYAALLAALNR